MSDPKTIFYARRESGPRRGGRSWMNPIIRREFLGLIRTPQALVAQACLIIALALLVCVSWPSGAQVSLSGAQSQALLSAFGYGLMAGMILLAPIFPATAIVRERRQGTLVLLLNSPMSAESIFFGKLAGSFGFVLLLLVLSFPASAACFAMGGIDRSQVALLYGLLALMGLQYTTIALWISTRSGSIDAALRWTFAAVLALVILPLGPTQVLHGLFAGSEGWIVDWVSSLSPVPVISHVLGNTSFASQGLLQRDAIGPESQFAVLAAASIILFSVLTIRRLSQRIFDKALDAGTITDEQSESVQFYRRIMYLWFFDPQRRSGAIGSWVNPLLIKETRCSRFGRSYWLVRIVGAALVISLGLMIATASGTEARGVATLGGILVVLQVGLIILLTPALASGLISSERETGGWPLLQMTPMSAGRIVRGKLMSAGLIVFLVLLATLPGYAVMIAIQPEQAAVVARVLVTLVLTAVFSLFLSAAISSLFRRTTVATATAYALLVGLCAGTMLVWIARDAPFTQKTVEQVLRVNPLAAALSAMRAPSFAEYQLIPGTWWILGIGTIVCLIVLTIQTWRLTRPQ
jgi:ABC-type transport system involved in multi-copper enzyme maturation permease subunit